MALAKKRTKPQQDKTTSKKKGKSRTSLRSVDEPLFELLREHRLEIANENGVPPYIIFHDSTLEEMAKTRPATLEAMRYISGVGEQKLEQYGETFLNIILSSPLPNILQNNLSDTVNETLSLLNDGLDAETIASKRNIKLSTVYTHFADAIEVGLIEAKDVLQLSEDEYNEIINALEMHLDDDRLKPAFDALDGSYDYGILKCVQASF